MPDLYERPAWVGMKHPFAVINVEQSYGVTVMHKDTFSKLKYTENKTLLTFYASCVFMKLVEIEDYPKYHQSNDTVVLLTAVRKYAQNLKKMVDAGIYAPDQSYRRNTTTILSHYGDTFVVPEYLETGMYVPTAVPWIAECVARICEFEISADIDSKVERITRMHQKLIYRNGVGISFYESVQKLFECMTYYGVLTVKPIGGL